MIFIKMVELINQRVSWDSELKQRFDRLSKELTEVWDPEINDDRIDIDDVILDWRFAEFLLKNEIYLTKLKTYVDTIKRDGLSKKAWSSINDLDAFLKDLWDKEGMEKDYNKLMDKLKNPKDLHKMKEKEVKKLSLYLSMNEGAALEAYRLMKGFVDVDRWFWSATLLGTGMKMEDINVFQTIWKVIKDNYQNNESFIELTYPGYKNLSATSQSIKSFLETYKWVISGQWLEWEWDELTVAHIGDVKNSIVNKEAVVAKLNELNNQRINKNKSLIETVSVNLPTSSFTKTAEWKLKYNWNEFKADDVMMFVDEISAAVTGGDFVNDREKSRLIRECKDTIYSNLRNKLLSDSNIKGEKSPDKVDSEKSSEKPNEVDKEADQRKGNTHINNKDKKNDKIDKKSEKRITNADEYIAEKNMVNIKDTKLKNRILELWFCENLDTDPVKFNKNKVKDYLVTLQSKSWKQLQTQKSLDRKVWIVSVQIALNYLGKSQLSGNSPFTVKSINWLYNVDMIEWVRAFQEKKGLKVDWKVWSKTIKKLVEELRWFYEIQANSVQVEHVKSEFENSNQVNKQEEKKDANNITKKDIKNNMQNQRAVQEVEKNTDVAVGTSITNSSTVSINISWNNYGKIVGDQTSNKVISNVSIKTGKPWDK